MSVLFIAVPVALLIALIAIITFTIQVRSGQYDDLQTPAQRVLFDDIETVTGNNEPQTVASTNQSKPNL